MTTISLQAVDFVPPRVTGSIKVRYPAHSATEEKIKKFEEAISRMKALPEDDPRSLKKQIELYQAYYDGNFDSVGFPDPETQVRDSWLYFPFHRMFLYFYERILSKLCDDPSFTVPFWNWDSQQGMKLPPMYTKKSSPLYTEIQNKDKPIIVLYDGNTDTDTTEETTIRDNLATMYRTMIANGKTAELFMGRRFVTGNESVAGAGSFEMVPHRNIMVWGGCGNRWGEDMGNFYSSGRDVMFYGLHANVDRMWDVWNKTLSHRNFDDEEWLGAAFYLYDENKTLVKVKVSDFVDTEKLGYTYQTSEIPWVSARPIRSTGLQYGEDKTTVTNITTSDFPMVVSEVVTHTVWRPKKSRSKEEREKEEEVIVIEGIEIDPEQYVKFDVYVNEKEGKFGGPTCAEFAGSFVNVPYKMKKGVETNKKKTCLKLGLSDMLEDLGAEDDESVHVILVPSSGDKRIRIGGVGIAYLQVK
ncbi:Polyphenol oxidase, central domain [Dillenia turbinata]|uniref:Polyphenol oxidase, central domain n=1 Tax=Dillenia turbinata TaxID=194707 RepID=A0AAN8ZF79_9MAGN